MFRTPSKARFGRERAASGDASPEGATADLRRSVVIDAKSFEEQFVQCSICNEKYDQKMRAPKLLTCNHTLCLQCLTQLVDHAPPPRAQQGEKKVNCPTCRREMFLNTNKIKQMPNNHYVVQMLDLLSQGTGKPRNLCLKHDQQKMHFFCEKCLIPVCRDCTVVDHKESLGHEVVDITEVWKKYSPQFNDVEIRNRQTLDKIKTRSDALANLSAALKVDEKQVELEIKRTLSKYRDALNEREDELIRELSKTVFDRNKDINDRNAALLQTSNQLEKLHAAFMSSKDNKDMHTLFTTMQELKVHEPHFMQAASEDDKKLFRASKISFVAPQSNSLLSDLRQLGGCQSGLHEFTEALDLAEVLYVYEAKDVDELSIFPDQIVRVLEKTDGGWWRGELDGRVGFFPANYVRLLAPEEEVLVNKH